MSASGFARSTQKRTVVTRETLERDRDVLWRMRDYFLRSRSRGARDCSGSGLHFDEIAACETIPHALRQCEDVQGPCPHEELIEDADGHGNFGQDSARISVIEDAIEHIEYRLKLMDFAEVHERQIA